MKEKKIDKFAFPPFGGKKLRTQEVSVVDQKEIERLGRKSKKKSFHLLSLAVDDRKVRGI